MISEGFAGRQKGVVEEKTDKSRWKERINSSRPLSTYLSAIRGHPPFSHIN